MNNKLKFQLKGTVIDKRSRQGVAGLSVQAWDKDLLRNDFLGTTITGEGGVFEINFDTSYFKTFVFDAKPDLFFKVFNKEKNMGTTANDIIWNADNNISPLTIEVDFNDEAIAEPWVRIGTYADLMEAEPAILKKIQQLNNGGYLFMIHPFLLMQDLGVEISQEVKEEILKRCPELSALSPVPYRAIKRSGVTQSIHVNLNGLFPRQ
jgi:hypothetical protein